MSFSVKNHAELEEIIVTSPPREDNLQNVAHSIRYLSGAEIIRSNINTLDEAQQFIPNLQMTETGLSTQIFIRGMGTGNSQGFEQSVGQYVDGIYYGRQQLLRAPLFDLSQLEVLRGPQSIVFGKNSIAGALNIESAKPTEQLEGYVNLSAAPEQSAHKVTAALSGPLSEDVRARIALYQAESDGYIENRVNGDGVASHERAIRGMLDWDVSENLQLSFKGEHNLFDTRGRPVEIIGDDPAVAGPFAGLNYNAILGALGHPNAITESKLDYHNDIGSSQFSDNQLDLISLGAKYEFNGYTFISQSGYLAYDFQENCDCDAVVVPVFDVLSEEDFYRVSQEFRLISPTGEVFDWVLGAFYHDSELNFSDDLRLPENSLLNGALNPAFAALPGTQASRNYASDSELWAIFGQFRWQLSETIQMNLGGRYTQERKNGSRRIDILDSATQMPQVQGVAALYENVFSVISEQGSGHNVDGRLKEESFTPLVDIQWRPVDNTMLYASYTTGFKAGGFDPRANTPESFEFDDERARSFELGSKSVFEDGTLELNTALFHTGYNDLQVSQFDGGVAFNVTNAAEVDVQGVEVDGRWAFFDGFLLGYSLAYLDREFVDFTGGNCYNRQLPDGDTINGVELCDYSGQSGRFAPKWSGSVSLEHHYTLGNKLDLLSSVYVNYLDEHDVHSRLDPAFRVDAYSLINLRVALESQHWELGLLINNVTDESSISFADNVALSGSTFGTNTYLGYVNPPRTVVGQLKLKF